jgi:hypothetical protein
MATGADIIRRNAGFVYDTYNTEFSRILEVLVANERITPGAITAAVNDLGRQQAALKNERDALERLRLEGQKSDAQLLATLEELKGRGAIASMEQATSASIARGRLREALSGELQKQKSEGQNAFVGAFDSRARKELFNTAYDSRGGNQAQVTGDLIGLGEDYAKVLQEGSAGLSSDPVALARFNQDIKAKTKDYLRSRNAEGTAGYQALGLGTMTEDEKNQFFDRLASQSLYKVGLGPDTETVVQAEARVRSELEGIARQVRGGGNIKTLSQQAAVLGVDESELQELSANALTDEEERQAAEQQTGVDVVKRAAYYSSKLPGSEFEFPTYNAYERALAERDPEAIELYNLTLKKNPSFIQLLSGGEYTQRMANIAAKEADIAKRRAEYDDLVRRGRQPTDYEKLYNEARRIYGNLFGRQGRIDGRRRAQEAQDAVRENPALAGALDEVMEEEGVSKAKRDSVISSLPADTVSFLEKVGTPDQDVDLNFSEREVREMATSDPQGLVIETNEAGDVVLAGTNQKLTELTLNQLYDALVPSVQLARPEITENLVATKDRLIQNYTEASPQDKRFFKERIKGIMGGMVNTAAQGRERQTVALDTLVPAAMPFVREAPALPTPTTEGPPIPVGEGAGQGEPQTIRSTKPAEPKVERQGAMVQPAIPASKATEQTDRGYMAAAQLAAVEANRAIADGTYNQTVSSDQFLTANDEALRGTAKELGIDDAAIALVDAEADNLAGLGRLTPNPTPEQIGDIVPEARYNEGAFTYASMKARNAYDTKNIS